MVQAFASEHSTPLWSGHLWHAFKAFSTTGKVLAPMILWVYEAFQGHKFEKLVPCTSGVCWDRKFLTLTKPGWSEGSLVLLLSVVTYHRTVLTKSCLVWSSFVAKALSAVPRPELSKVWGCITGFSVAVSNRSKILTQWSLPKCERGCYRKQCTQKVSL